MTGAQSRTALGGGAHGTPSGLPLLRRLACALVLGIAGAGAVAAGAANPEKFRLTPVLLDRLESLQASSEAVAAIGEEEDLDAQSVEDLARKLDADPRIRALLARHRISSQEYATAVFAMLHAGMYLAMESTADKKARAAAMASFTPEQRANIELLRRRIR